MYICRRILLSGQPAEFVIRSSFATIGCYDTPLISSNGYEGTYQNASGHSELTTCIYKCICMYMHT